MVAKRKITKKDWKTVANFISNSLKDRKANKFRVNHELIWTELDRQVQMQPLRRVDVSGKELPNTWRSAFELGELSRASEVFGSLGVATTQNSRGRKTAPQDVDRQELPDLLSQRLYNQQRPGQRL